MFPDNASHESISLQKTLVKIPTITPDQIERQLQGSSLLVGLCGCTVLLSLGGAV